MNLGRGGGLFFFFGSREERPVLVIGPIFCGFEKWMDRWGSGDVVFGCGRAERVSSGNDPIRDVSDKMLLSISLSLCGKSSSFPEPK